MEVGVGAVERFVGGQPALALDHPALDLAQVVVGDAGDDRLDRAELDDDPQLDQVLRLGRFVADERRLGGEPAAVEFGDAERVRRRPVEDAFADQLADRLAQHGPADIEPVGQPASGGRLVTGRQPLGQDVALEDQRHPRGQSLVEARAKPPARTVALSARSPALLPGNATAS